MAIDRLYAAAGAPGEPSLFCGLVLPLVAPAQILTWTRDPDLRYRRADPSRRLSALLGEDDAGEVFIGAIRPSYVPVFDRPEIARFRAIVPHLRRAMAMQWELTCAELRSRQARRVLDRLAAAVVLLDGRGRVQLANRQASEMIVSGEALTVEEGRLRAPDNRCLEGAIGRATLLGSERRKRVGEALLLARPNGQAPLAALVLPARPRLARMAELTPAAMLLVTDPMRDETPEAVLRALYALTPAEAAMLKALLPGEGLQRAAARLGISPNTAKAHLARILDKTEAGGQSGLIRLISGGLGVVRWDYPNWGGG
jgi:DNA-binding CsgD family transcriptional regulator